MYSMRAMLLDNEIDDELENFQKARDNLLALTSDQASKPWYYRRDGEFVEGERVRKLLHKMLESTYRLDGLMATREMLGG